MLTDRDISRLVAALHGAPTSPKVEAYLAQRRRIGAKHKAQVEVGIPIPLELRGGPRVKHEYNFEDLLDVGDSMWIPCEAGEAQELRVELNRFAASTGWEFTTRSQAKDPACAKGSTNAGLRIWRTK